QGAGLVVELAAAFHAKLLRNRDLYVADTATPPQWLEQVVAEAQREQVLHRFFAEIMINAIDLVLGKHAANTLVDQLRSCTTESRGFLEAYAGLRRAQTGGGEVVAGHRKEPGRGGQEDAPANALPPLERVGELPEVLGLCRIHRDVVHH